MGGGLPNGVFPALALLFPATEESLRAGVATLFGEAGARTAAHYRLENDIDATQTGQTNWHEGEGFLPIGDSASPFLGALNGAGYAVRGLQMRRAGEMAGFFGVVGASGRISNLGVDGGEVEGGATVGLLAARVEAGGVIEGAWGRGRVRGSDNVGGLVGYLAEGAMMRRSWFGGHVRGRRNVGGLVGGAEARSVSADTIANSWAMAQTYGFVGIGGLAGNWESGNRMTASWAGGPFVGLGSGYGLASGSGESSASYSGVETSGRAAAGIGGTAVDSLQTLVAPEWSNAVWDFGSDSDFPVLRNIATSDGRGRSLQAGGMIFGLTRLLRGDGTAFPALPLDMTTSVSGDEQSVLRLDVNGLAADDGSATARLSSCRISGGAISAASNYNGARVSMLLLSPFGARLSLYDEDFCAAGIDSGEGGLATLRLSYAGAGSESEDVLHLDYAAQLSPGLSPPSPFGFADAPTNFYAVAAEASLNAVVLTVRVNGWQASFLNHRADAFSFAGGSDTAVVRLAGGSSRELFNADNREYELTLLARDGLGLEKELQLSLRSSPRAFAGELLSLSLAAGVSGEVLSPSRASLTIWHNDDEEEEYVLLGGNDVGITVDERSGGLYAQGIFVRGGEYEMTLELRGGGVTARRDIKAVYEEHDGLQPVFAGVLGTDLDGALTVFSGATAGESVLTVTVLNGSLVSFSGGGFGSEGGAPAVITLSVPATMLFQADGMALSLTLTATSAGGAVTTTTRIVSSARGFDGSGLSTLFATTALAAGMEVFAATAASLTIWHNKDQETYTLKGPNAALFTVGADGAVSVKGSLPSSPDEVLVYALTLELRGGGTVSERSLLLELKPPRPGLSAVGEVEIPALSGSGYALLTVTPTNGGTVRGFVNESGFGSAGGTPATITLSKPATALFKADGMELSLTLTATSAGGAVTTTTRIVSSARGFDGLGLSTLFATPALAAGMEVFAATDASLTIWHAFGGEKRYELLGPNAALFTVGADGAVSVKGSLPSSPDEVLVYALTLELRGGGTVSERSLLLELRPPRPGLSAIEEVEVPALSGSGYALLTVTPTNGGTVRGFHEGGFGSEGGTPATITLSKPATALFQADGMALSLTLTATSAGGAVTTTTRIVSSARGFDGLGLSTLFATPALAADMEVFAATAAGMTIWHNTDQETYTLKGPNAALFTVGADGAVSVKGSLPSSPDEVLVYALTLELRGGGTVSERSLLLELKPPRPGLSAIEEVEIPALSGSGYALLTVTPTNGGTVRGFVNESGFGSAGGTPAVITLSKPATALFKADGMELSLTLTAASAGGAVTTTTRIVSSARGFDGLGLSTLFATTALAAGMEVFAATDASLTIWHAFGGEKRYELLGPNAALFTVGADGAVSVKGSLPSSPDEVLVYALTLELRGGGTVSERSLLLELRPPRPGLSAAGEVEVPALSGSGYALLTVTPTNGGTVRGFVNESGFGSAGGTPAVITLSKPATALFKADGMELSLTLTAASAGGAVTTTTRIVSSARGFDGAGLSTLFATTALAAGMEVFAATDASLTIWHAFGGEKRYELLGPNAALFTVGADGAVSVKGSLPSSPDEVLVYALTLELRGGGTVSERSLLLELRPPRPGLSAAGEVEIPALSESGYALLTVTPTNGGTVRGFVNESGFGSAGGTPAVITLSKPATALFKADGMELSLTLTAASAGGAVTTTTRIVSSARGFDGLGLSTLFATTALAAGMEVFAATDASLTIWHAFGGEKRYELLGPNAALFTVGADGAVSVKGSLPSSPDEVLVYALTLELRGGGTVSERSLLLELRPPRPGLSAAGEVEVPALSGSGYALLTVTPTNGGTVRGFVNESGFGSAGGTPAVITLSKPATALFKADGMELSLTLTAASAGGAVTTTTRIVSSARGFDGAGLSTLFATTALAAGMEVFAATDASLTIWHAFGGEKRYELLGPNAALFTVGADGAVSVKGSLPSSPDEVLVYALTLELRGGGTVSERSLLLELRPPRPGLSAAGEVEIPALSESGYALLTVTPTNGGTVRGFVNESGFGSAGGTPATITLSKPATALFKADGMELSLTLTATSAGGAVTTTTRIVSSARGFDGAGLSTLFATTALAAGMEVFAATDASLTIWHAFGGEKRYELLGPNAALFTVGADGAVSVKGSLPSSPDEVLVYALTLELRGGGTVSERSLLLELKPPRPGLSAVGEVEIPALSGSGYALLTVTPTNGGTVRGFVNESGFGSAGGTPATITLSKPATALFKADGMELSLTLTATSAGGAVTTTTRIVSSARGFDGAGLSTLFATTALAAGMEVFAATDASLTIWHAFGGEKRYELLGPNAALFTVGADGAVSVKGSLPSSPDEVLVYALTLELRGGGTVSERSLLLELRPPRPGLSAIEEVEVPALSGSGYALLTVTPTNGGTVRGFHEGGFGSEGGTPATITLSKPATALFQADGMELSLTLTAASAGGAVTTTTRIVSSARGFDGLGLSTLFATTALAADMEVFAATAAGMTIWHNTDQETYTLKGPNAALFTVGADGAVSVKGSLMSSPDEALRYALTLELRGGGTVSERSLLLELKPPRPGLSAVGEVEIPALSESGYALLTVTPTNGGTVRGFVNESGFGSEGGAPATITLSKPATALFKADGMELSLTLTAASAGGAVTTTTRIVSSARGFDGAGLSTLFATTALAAGMEVFAATDASLTIWHAFGGEKRYELLGPNAALFTVGADGAVSVKGSLPSSPDEVLVYALTLELRGGGTVSERSLLLELRPPRPGLSAIEEVEVPALSGSGYALLTVTPTNGGTVRGFVNESGFGSAGGTPAVITLSKPATALFQADGMALSLTLTAASAGGAVTTTTRIVSSARGFDGLGLSTLFATTALAAGMEVFAATDASLTIWHAFGGEKRYELLGPNAALFTVGADGAVSVKGSLPSSPDEVLVYALTLELRGGGTVSERSLLLELRPPRPGLSAIEEVEIPALSESGYALLTVTPTNGGTVRGFVNESGFGSAGGTPATITLSKPATALFKADGMELSLTLTATSAGGAVTTTTRIVSSARGFDGSGLSTLFATTALAAGMEVFAATDASLTIWHAFGGEKRYELLGPNAALFTVGADGAVSVKGSLPSSPDEVLVYALTLELRGGGTVSERSLLLELRPPRPGLSAIEEVEIPALSESGYALLTVTPTNGGTVRGFVNESGFGSAGGTPATITLSKPATALFQADGMELSLTLTAASAGGAVTTTTRIVSSARGFDGSGLSTLFATPALAAGMEVFAATDASLTIWHAFGGEKRYELLGPNAALFTVGADGAVSVKGSLPSSPDEVLVYALTLELRGGGDGVGAIVAVGIEAAAAGVVGY